MTAICNGNINHPIGRLTFHTEFCVQALFVVVVVVVAAATAVVVVLFLFLFLFPPCYCK